VIPAGRSGVWGGEPLEVTLVDPTLVIEVVLLVGAVLAAYRFFSSRPPGRETAPGSVARPGRAD
jgi:hypothetical protein